MSLFIAKELHALLQYWFDINLAGEFDFQLDMTLGTHKDKTDEVYQTAKAMIGSELSLMGLLARSIPDYEMLGSVITGRQFSHKTNFMPRIPKELRGTSGSDADFYDQQFIKCPVRIPLYLLKWVETRRACVVDDEVPVPLVDMRSEQWFHKLPYHCFYLNVRSPFVLADPYESKEWSVQNFIVADEGDYVRILFWANENQNALFTEPERSRLKKAIKELKMDKVTPVSKDCINLRAKMHDAFVGDFVLKKETTLIRETRGIYSKEEFFDLYDPQDKVKDDEQVVYQRVRAMLEMVNGFCKLLAGLGPAATIRSVEPNEADKQFQPPRQWFELPLQTVEYFHTHSENDVVVIRNGSGSEKSPHVRRGHTRRIVQKDGTVKEVWVKEMTIRKDKLTTEQLQGGALKIQ